MLGEQERSSQDRSVAGELPGEADLLGDEAHVDAAGTRLARRLAITGVGGVVLATLAIGMLHVVEPSRSLDPLSRTISEYALLSNGWIFDAAVLLLSLSSALILLALTVRELVTWQSWGTAVSFVWCIGLVGLVIFPKQGFNPDPSLAGRVHWTWTLIAFFSLPIGACLMCWEHRLRSSGWGSGGWPRWAVRWSMAAGGWFVVLTAQTALSALTSIQAWRLVGLVERALSLTEMTVVAMLGMWVLQVSRPGALPIASAKPDAGD